MAWDPNKYLQFESHRTRPVGELLARVPLAAPSLVADLGCGPGNSTAVLAERWPEARIIGIDNSSEMIERARSAVPHAEWLLADISNWQPAQPVDVVFANASLQWVPQPEAVLRRLFSFVAPGGAFAFQIPANQEGPPHTLIDDALRELNLDRYIDRERLSRYVLSPRAYFRILASEAAAIDIWDTDYLQVLEGEDAVLSWVKGTALVPILTNLSATDAERFLESLALRLRQAYPPEPGGGTLLPFRRRFVVAKR